jgi:hypothetical protein
MQSFRIYDVLAVVILVLCLAYDCTATSIVVSTDLQQIVVGADSKIVQSDEKLCKVFKTGQMFWAMSGQIDPFGSYNVPATVAAARRESTSIEEAFQRFQTKIIGPLQGEMHRQELAKHV